MERAVEGKEIVAAIDRPNEFLPAIRQTGKTCQRGFFFRTSNWLTQLPLPWNPRRLRHRFDVPSSNITYQGTPAGTEVEH